MTCFITRLTMSFSLTLEASELVRFEVVRPTLLHPGMFRFISFKWIKQENRAGMAVV
jgi:hypothetical protein